MLAIAPDLLHSVREMYAVTESMFEARLRAVALKVVWGEPSHTNKRACQTSKRHRVAAVPGSYGRSSS